MATTKFYLRSKGPDCAIYAFFQISRSLRMRVTTGLNIHSDNWSYVKVKDKETGKTKDNSSGFGIPKSGNAENKNIKSNLEKLAVHINSEFNNDFANGVSFTNDWLKQKINTFFERPDESVEDVPDDDLFSVYLKNYIDFRKLKGDTKITTERKFNQLQTKYESFEKKKRTKFLISDIDHKFILTFKKYMIEDLKNMESTANEIIRKLKTVLLNARNNDDKVIHKNINALKISSTQAVKVFLSLDEIEKIKDSKIVGGDLQHAKDWLIIGCNTGQRVSDLLRMNKEMIYTKTDSNGDSFNLIGLVQEKTGSNVAIPVNDEVQTILDKYDGDFPPTFGQKGDSKFVLFNRYIKTVCRLSGITNTVKGRVFNEETKRNEITETEKYKLVSSHICRRSFATNYYGDNRFTTAELMSITGHKTESVFLNYIGKTAEEHALKSAATFRKIAQEKKEKEKEKKKPAKTGN